VQHVKRKKYEDSLGHVVLEGEQLNNVYTFDYLGCRIQSDGDEKADINHCMSIAQTIFKSLSHLWGDHQLTNNMKIRLYICRLLNTQPWLWGMDIFTISEKDAEWFQQSLSFIHNRRAAQRDSYKPRLWPSGRSG